MIVLLLLLAMVAALLSLPRFIAWLYDGPDHIDPDQPIPFALTDRGWGRGWLDETTETWHG